MSRRRRPPERSRTGWFSDPCLQHRRQVLHEFARDASRRWYRHDDLAVVRMDVIRPLLEQISVSPDPIMSNFSLYAGEMNDLAGFVC